MRCVGRPNQDLKTVLPEGESERGRVLVKNLQNIKKLYKGLLVLGVGIFVT